MSSKINLQTCEYARKSSIFQDNQLIYYKRSRTPAAAKENQVPEEVVKDRFDRLLAQVQEIARERSSRFEGNGTGSSSRECQRSGCISGNRTNGQ